MPKGTDAENRARVRARWAQESFAGRRIHLIGIGGCGMRALAQMLLDRDAVVSGSDMVSSGASQRLADRGAAVHIGQRAQNIPQDAEMVVYSVAVHERNPELLAAEARGLEMLKYSQMLGRLMSQQVGIAVAGTHGKSTTSAMVAWALTDAGAEPSFIVGATVEQLGGPSGVGHGKHFVAEACEFDKSFLNLCPTYAAILNIEEDHLDCYQDLWEIVEAFRAFTARVEPGGVLIANGEDRDVSEAVRTASCEVQTFGLADGCTWWGRELSTDRGRVTMDVHFAGQKFFRLAVPLPGRHSAYNALAATALLHNAGLDAGQIRKSLQRFTGARRRMTHKGTARGITVVDDYAHHPTEIQATLRAIRDYYHPARLWCVFQPHQHSRTRFLLKDFARSFGAADEVLVPDIYFVRDSDREKDYICSQDLVAQIRFNGGSAGYFKSFGQIEDHLRRELADGDLVVTMGAGNIWEVADEIVRWLGTDS